MNIPQSNHITNYLFSTDHNVVFQESTGNALPPNLKHEMLKIYQQSPNRFSEDNHSIPINQRNIELIHVLPILAQTDYFIEKLNSHALKFCKNINKIYSIDIQMALWDTGPFKTLSDIGKFMESIIAKNNDRRDITHNEKIAFRFLLTGLLKMDHDLDVYNATHILNILSKYFHPDKSIRHCELYSCILSKGPRLAMVIFDVWSLNNTPKLSLLKNEVFGMSVYRLITLISRLNESTHEIPRVAERCQLRKQIQLRLETLQSISLQENLLKTLIKYNEQALLEALTNRADFNINELRISGETPLIYAIKQRSQWIIDFLIKKQDVNALGLENKTPLQIAIDCYSKYLDENESGDDCNPYKPVIESLLNCPQLDVNAQDSLGMTALCHIAMLPKADSTYFSFVEKLISRGANIEKAVYGYETVISLLGQNRT
ncbi:ankyrin repeat domain-containing protein [Endozoicomonas sp. GU-1]|uniref:ankyrin repeat domain-containing protein n=1 Tax=Endozoicomonas sp. GU-1 TaxID=3009078 RepID=UPI0022B30F07|nr:ankyrin repeat domain-containing protein [Endozoicomonas sp. GU-1]WBA80350.1 ankyrin repeat domain-containing protein [Endozoicomonas sp. GU-1]